MVSSLVVLILFSKKLLIPKKFLHFKFLPSETKNRPSEQFAVFSEEEFAWVEGRIQKTSMLLQNKFTTLYSAWITKFCNSSGETESLEELAARDRLKIFIAKYPETIIFLVKQLMSPEFTCGWEFRLFKEILGDEFQCGLNNIPFISGFECARDWLSVYKIEPKFPSSLVPKPNK